jgi:hypothetical protein
MGYDSSCSMSHAAAIVSRVIMYVFRGTNSCSLLSVYRGTKSAG